MRILFLCAATVAALVLHPPSTRAQTNSMVSESRPKPAYVVIDQLIAQGALLALDSTQVAKLSKLKERLRADRGRLKRLAGSRVPGKSVPRYVRVFYTSDQALRLALDVLTQDQPVLATRLLHAPGPPKNQADTKPGCGTHG